MLNQIESAKSVDKHRGQRDFKTIPNQERYNAAHEAFQQTGACEVHKPYHSEGVTTEEACCQAENNKNNTAGAIRARLIYFFHQNTNNQYTYQITHDEASCGTNQNGRSSPEACKHRQSEAST